MSRHVVLVSTFAVLVSSACAVEEDDAPSQRLRRRTSGNASESDESGGAASSSASSSSQGSNAPEGENAKPGKPAAPLGELKQGIATFYDADGTGNCSFPASSNLMVVAPHKERYYGGSAACGACMRVTGQKGSVVVRVVDSCPVDTAGNDCGDTNADLDLSAEAFAQIENPDVGIANVSFQVVPCDVAGPMQFRFKDGSSQWWTAVQVRNHREPIAKVEYLREGSWIAMAREDDNFFIEPNGVGEHPQGLPLRITSLNGQVLEENLPIDDSTTLTGQHQFD